MSIDNSAWGVLRRGTGNSTALRFAATANSGVCTLPTAWGGTYWLNLCARSNNCRYMFADTSGCAVGTTAGAVGGGTVGTNVGGLLLAGIKEQVKVADGMKWLAIVTESGTTDVDIELRSDPNQ